MGRALVWVVVLATCVGCGRSVHKDAAVSAPTQGIAGSGSVAASPAVGVAAGEVPGVTAASEQTIGTPRIVENLTIFPVLSKKQEDIGPITTLDAALAKGTASVHEIGAGGGPSSGGAQVNSLVIENKGETPVYVLAGTIVKGGNQDRQIGEDFIVGARQSIPVDAYCVEHGRWANNRDGVATAGQFGTIGLLTDSRVRTAAEYGKDQGEVWANVAKVNEANKKQASSGTLLASVDSADIVARRTALTKKVEAFLSEVQPGDDVVGFAYAVDGKVRSVRWFVHHKVFGLFEDALVGTAAMEAITAQAQTIAGGKPLTPPPALASADVSKFVKDVQDSKIRETHATPGMNDNTIRESKEGYSAATKFKAPAASPTAPPKPVSTSVTAF
jgi:hypothetical protein